jgi:hypothetical protein
MIPVGGSYGGIESQGNLGYRPWRSIGGPAKSGEERVRWGERQGEGREGYRVLDNAYVGMKSREWIRSNLGSCIGQGSQESALPCLSDQ